MLQIEITSWSGFPSKPIVVTVDEKAQPEKPTLRLIRGGK